MEWASRKLCKSVSVEVVHTYASVAKVENRHMTALVNNNIEESWIRVEVKRIVGRGR